MRVLLIENTGVTHHGQVGVALAEAGALIDIARPFAGQPLPDGFATHDAVVVFGGEQSARDDASHPYLPRLATLLRQAVEAGQPVLGICLGSQILARGFGADNHIGTAPEFGWTEVDLTEAGRTDPVLSAAGSGFRPFQWHSDTFTLPPGAVHLARSAGAAAQAFRIGRAGYGTQFHFEANRAVVADWSRRFPGLTEAMHPGWDQARSDLDAAHGAAADAAGLALARAFVARIGAP